MIYIVEDDDAIRELEQYALQSNGYEVASFASSEPFWQAMRTEAPELVILDVMLPGVDGFTLMDYIAPTGTPVIFLTAKATVEDRVRGLRLGAEDYLVKPFDILELLVRMEKVLARSDKHPQRFRYRDIAVDEASHTVTKSGIPVLLKPMEYELLLTFIRHPGMVMTREDLLHQVWGDAFIGETRTVDVHVAALRRKLDLGGELATVYKIGYRLEVLA